ncbi:GNAT family N-acetyltransferase [Metabacillus sp. KIGAM252]|uniref:GNAT family N-acetyltransferase n=1 Tax=Metabacillus flavus TaxID=2823519 RepID=A0ABS5LCD6_9BACI|nr:GNAT family N-acetyltransferase [Metabacillus flavus]MBS2968243.1 GNAT family N-acetyltransferase [Metabacillus flavus]
MLSEEQLSDIKKLQAVCEEADGIQLKLNWDMLEYRENGVKQDFFHYETDGLAAFIGLYGFGNKVEVCGMVNPGYRRKGLFSAMFKEALEEARSQGYHTILLNAPSNSKSAKGFLDEIQAPFAFSEHQMKWMGGPLPVSEDVILRTSEKEDFALEVQLEADCFGFSFEEAEAFTKQRKQEQDHEFWIIEYNGKAVGKVRVAGEKGEAWIYGFAVSPEHQKKGIGRKTLFRILKEETAKGNSVFLEVEAKNTRALKLYESCGFRAYYAQDYYLSK